MSVRVSIQQLQQQLDELLAKVAQTGEEHVIQRDGKDYAVIVSVRAWRRGQVGCRLDALGPQFRLDSAKQQRAEQLLAAKKVGRLSAVEQRELRSLLRECDELLHRRAAALDQLP